MAPELAGHLMEKLMAAGARDVQYQPVQMKKNRPAMQIRVLTGPEDLSRLAQMVFEESSTFGVRAVRSERLCLRRRIESVQTPLGPVAVKVGLWGDRVLKVAPEYEACRALAEREGRTLREIFDLARRAIEEQYFPHR
jgi:uncharacterized protein (DUF111 family)